MNVAILGGRFDPPHYGHVWVARQILEKGPAISQVWLMPVNKHPWKDTVADSSDRLSMVRLIEGNGLKSSAIEIERGGTSYTVETIKVLKENYPTYKFYWIVGSDTLNDFSKWRQAQKLSLIAPFLVFPRGGYPIKMLPIGMQKINGDELIQTNLSSTHIRNRLQKGLSIYGLVPSQVEEYIRQKKLYVR